MQKENKDKFYQSKYEYYKKILIALCVIAPLAETTYFISDCQLFNRFAVETIIPRFAVLIPMIIYIIISRKTNNYKIMSIASFVMLHCVMWFTIWATHYLPDKDFTREGFIIMHIMFQIASLATPKKWSLVAHTLVIANILIGHSISYYENIDLILSLGIPCFAGIQLLSFVLEDSYKEHYELVQKLELSSRIDQLTGAYNRHILEDLMITDTNTLKNPKNKDISIAIIDIDFFKNINDTYGHTKGDKVIINIVEIMKKLVFARDYIIRWGGEEFLIIFYSCDLQMALKKCEKIRKAIESTNNGICKTTVSIGISKYENDNYDRSVSFADKALYHAKETGRNKVVIYDENIIKKKSPN